MKHLARNFYAWTTAAPDPRALVSTYCGLDVPMSEVFFAWDEKQADESCRDCRVFMIASEAVRKAATPIDYDLLADELIARIEDRFKLTMSPKKRGLFG